MCKEALIYEWCEGEQYTQRIRDFLNDIDECMLPRLSQRVNIKEYSHKLARNAHTLFADFRGEDIGACSIYCNRENAFISSIAVKENYTKCGVATELLKRSIELARHYACKKVALNVCYTNQAALNLYKKNNFVEIASLGIWKTMELDISYSKMK